MEEKEKAYESDKKDEDALRNLEGIIRQVMVEGIPTGLSRAELVRHSKKTKRVDFKSPQEIVQ